jgi:peptidoglycan/LPS O-acetylase OafA/YrhL
MNYRREIDGLSALVILPVLAFHFAPSTLPLGYLGVDLFFVISGHLIAQQVLRLLALHGLSLVLEQRQVLIRCAPTATVAPRRPAGT